KHDMSAWRRDGPIRVAASFRFARAVTARPHAPIEPGRPGKGDVVSSTSLYDELNDGKATFDNVYNHPDPRAYFATLGRLGYCIPEQAKPVFGAVIDALKEERGTEVPTVVDIGCSYGVNAALLKYELSIDDLYARYTQPQLSRLDTETLLKRDAGFLDRESVGSG